MAGTEDEFDRLEIQEMWPNEAWDFTPWLSKNLHLLGDSIGMELEPVQREKMVGSLYLDILAREKNTGALVAIENLYGWTDVDHLGRLFIYAAGCNAPVSILIAEEFTYEIAQTLHQMNEWTREEVRFYGVKVEVVNRLNDPDPQPRFRKVVYPGGWDEAVTQPPDPTPPHVQKHRAFFQPLIQELMRRRFANKANLYFNHSGRYFPTRFTQELRYAASFGKVYAWVTFNIRMKDKEQTKRIFDELIAQRKDIEASIDAVHSADWHWSRNDHYRFSSISVKREGRIDDPPEKLAETRAWMLDLLVQFKACFDPRLAEILQRLPVS